MSFSVMGFSRQPVPLVPNSKEGAYKETNFTTNKLAVLKKKHAKTHAHTTCAKTKPTDPTVYLQKLLM